MKRIAPLWAAVWWLICALAYVPASAQGLPIGGIPISTGGGGATLIHFDSFYSGTGPFTLGAAAQVNDVIVVSVSSDTGNVWTAAMTGALALGGFGLQQSQTAPGRVDILTAIVTTAGTPSITIAGVGSNAPDPGMCAWIVRGLASATKNTGGAAGNVASNPLTVSLSPTGTSSGFIMYGNELTDDFTSFTASFTQDVHNTSHIHACGHILNVSASTYAPGANVVAATSNMIAVIYLN